MMFLQSMQGPLVMRLAGFLWGDYEATTDTFNGLSTCQLIGRSAAAGS